MKAFDEINIKLGFLDLYIWDTSSIWYRFFDNLIIRKNEVVSSFIKSNGSYV